MSFHDSITNNDEREDNTIFDQQNAVGLFCWVCHEGLSRSNCHQNLVGRFKALDSLDSSKFGSKPNGMSFSHDFVNMRNLMCSFVFDVRFIAGESTTKRDV